MPAPRFIHGRKCWVGAKIEAERGTPETLTADDYAILAYEPEINPEVDFEQRQPAGLAMGQLAAEPTGLGGRARLRVELRGSGDDETPTLPHWAATLLIASGMAADAGELSLVSDFDDQKCVTLAINKDGLLKQLTGAMCNAIVSGETGRRTWIEFDVRGIWVSPTDEAVPSPTHETTRPLMLKGATLTVGGEGELMIGSFRHDFGNTIELRDDESKDGAFLHAFLADRAPTFEFDPEARKVADHDVFGQWVARTEAALSLQLGSGAGNQLTLAAPRLQYIDPREANRKQLLTHQTRGQFNAEAGDDEFTYTFA